MTPDAILHHVHRARARDHEAFTPLVEWFHPTVFGLAYSILRDRHTAEDVAQDTFLAAWERLPDLHEPGAFAAWLRMITRNLALNYQRSNRYRQALQDRHDLLAQQGLYQEAPDFEKSQADARALVEQAFKTLSPRIAEVMALYYLRDASVEETAQALELTSATVRQRLRRGRQQLRRHFESRWEHAFDEALRDFTPTKVLRRFVAGLALGCVMPVAAQAAASPADLPAHRRKHEGGTSRPLWQQAAVGAALGCVLFFIPLAFLYSITHVERVPRTGDEGPAPAKQAASASREDNTVSSNTPEPQPLELPPIDEFIAPPSISGTVRDEAGNPIPGAVVTAFTGVYDDADKECRYCLEGSVADAPSFSASTGGDGSYKIADVVADNPLIVTVKENRHCWAFREHVKAGQKDVDFILSAANLFEGTVVDAVTGAPIPEFEARITTVDPGGFYSVARADMPWRLFQSADGQFQLHTDAYVDVQIAVRAKGYIEDPGPFYDLRGGYAAEVIALRPGSTLTGYAVDGLTGAPVPGALIGIGRETVEADNFTRQNWGQTSTISDADGFFTLTGVDFTDDLAFVISWHKDYAPALSPIPARRDKEVELAFFAPARVHGVLTMNGAPLKLVRPKGRYFVGSRHQRYQTVYTTSEDGYFELNNLPPGDHSIFYAAAGEAEAYGAESITVGPGEDAYIERDFGSIGGIRFEVVGYESYDDPWVVLFPPGRPNHELRSIRLVTRPALTLPMLEPDTYRLQIVNGEEVLYEEDITTEDGMIEERVIDITPYDATAGSEGEGGSEKVADSRS
jgi:RNA polymerase sigma-70 factor (ECF subfamily)